MPLSSVNLALEVFEQPSSLRKAASVEVPQDALVLIRIAAGDQETTAQWAQYTGRSEQGLQEACVLYLRSLISSAGTDARKLLVLPSNAGLAELKSHKRWLLMWLHPDRHTSAWETSLFRRISEASKKLEQELANGQNRIPPKQNHAPRRSAAAASRKNKSGGKRAWRSYLAKAMKSNGADRRSQQQLLKRQLLVFAGCLVVLAAIAIALTSSAMLSRALGQ